MADIRKLLNGEIHRIARKEIKAELAPLALKISNLKKIVLEQAKIIKELKGSSSPKFEPNQPAVKEVSENKDVRINASGIKKIRVKLGLSQSQFAKLIGASLLSVSHWELEKTVPRAEFKRKMAAFRSMGKRELAKIMGEKNIEKSKRGRKPKEKVVPEVSPEEKAPEVAPEEKAPEVAPVQNEQ